ncbi:hypothetical protein [Pedobacter hartonius]|uniref:Protein kinase domain-containing protein n=1 Tax=Pedobacter hartonius TaxID=425514 RepID=A0A1H4BWH9_9SPHI|nr:hypothetical protein [Pedobacter hartonius]SEA52454.1 hypothetical protein SAMN05443550_103495 [Pedobacter hartonius]
MKTQISQKVYSDPEINKLLKDYLIISVLKEDKKGNVYKAKDCQDWLKTDHVIIKQGKAQMLPDEFGRGMKERLRWQLYVQQSLSNVVGTPEIKDFFRYKGHDYLIMEYIEGRTLREIVAGIFEKKTWDALSAENRISILEL